MLSTPSKANTEIVYFIEISLIFQIKIRKDMGLGWAAQGTGPG